MLDNLLSKVNEYVERHVSLESDMNEQDAKNAKLYVPGVRLQKLAQLKEVYHDSCKILHSQYEEDVKKIFADAYKEMKETTMQPLDQGILNNISLMEQLEDISQDEADALFEATRNNYLANKKVYQFINKIGKGKSIWKKYIEYLDSGDPRDIYFVPITSVKEVVEGLERYIMDNIFGDDYKEFSHMNYNIRNILKGDYINDVKSKGDYFINRYKTV